MGVTWFIAMDHVKSKSLNVYTTNIWSILFRFRPDVANAGYLLLTVFLLFASPLGYKETVMAVS